MQLPVDAPVFRKGRNVADGYARGWGMQHSDVRQKVRDDALYRAAILLAEGRSVMTEDNRINIFLILRDHLKHIPFGHIVEFGSYRAGNAIFMAHVVANLYPATKVYAFDSFIGMPKTDAKIDAHGEGDFSDVDLDEIKAFAADRQVTNIEFVQGFFEQTAPTALPKIGPIALAHIDCDIYSAVAYSYDAVKPYMVDRGYIVFDDAIAPSCLGATEAVEELVIRRDGLHSEQIFPHFVFRAAAARNT